MTELIGPEPDVATPGILTPLHSDGGKILDARGRNLAFVETDHLSVQEDDDFAALIVETLNEKFGAVKAETEEPESTRYPYPVPGEPDHYFVAPNWVVYDTRGPEFAAKEFRVLGPHYGYYQTEPNNPLG